MKRVITLLIVLLSVVLIGLGQTRRPKLIVGIVVEQMRYDFLTRYWDRFSDQGFKRLVQQGVVFHNAGYDYLNVNSASSFASLATGTHPNIHGIVGSEWYNKLKGKVENCVEDRETLIVGKKSNAFAGSPKKILSGSFSDQLSLTTLGASKIVVIAPDMESAILSGGKLADEVYWFDSEDGKWVSSSYYFKSNLQLPQWVRTYNKRRFPDMYLNKVWNTTYDLSVYKESLPDQSLGEKGLAGQTVFPYDLKQLKRKIGRDKKYWLFEHTPFFDVYVKDFAISAMVYDGVGKDNVTDYLFVVFPAEANISQVFGIRSVELEDAYIKLDKAIAHLLEALDDIVGRDNYLVFLTSDRGACDNPSLLKNLGLDVNFFQPEGTKLVLDAYLRAIYNQSGLVDMILPGQVYLNQEQIDRMRIDPLEIERYAASLYSQFAAVQYALPTQLLMNGSFSSGVLYLAYNSYNPERSGDVFFTLKPNSFVENADHTLPSYSACYCQCSNQNQLPLIFFGYGLKHQDVYRHVDITSVAPTLSALIGIQLPENSTAPILQEVLQAEKK